MTPIEAYNKLIMSESQVDIGVGVHKISEKVNHRWRSGFLAGYTEGQRDALLKASREYLEQDDDILMREHVSEWLRRMAEEL